MIALYAIFAFSQLTTYPRLWLDEGFKMQLARNFSETGTMGTQFEPGKLEYSVHNASTGWPVVLMLGAFFKIFGVSFATGRLFSALILIIFVTLVYFLIKREWGSTPALFSLLLFVTYAPLYANGKMILAEIPGLLFLLLGLLFISLGGKAAKLSYFFFGLFAASKLAFTATFLPALAIGLAFAIYCKQINWKQAISSMCITVALVLPTIYMSLVSNLGSQSLANPYGQASLVQTIISNLKLFFSSSTLWHMIFLLFVTCWALVVTYQKGNRDWRGVTLVCFGTLTFAYWLVSPGVFRYLLPLILILLAIFPTALFQTFSVTGYPKVAKALVFGLVLVQGWHFATSASISHGNDYLRFEKYLQDNPIPSDKSVGIINSPFAPVIVPRENMSQFVRIDAIEEGKNPLDAKKEKLPDYLIYETENLELDITPYYFHIIEPLYKKIADFDQIIVWQKI